MGANSFQLTRSSSGLATPQNLDWMSGKFVTFGIVGSSSGTFSATAEASVQDIENTSSSAMQWFAISSAITGNSSACVFQGPISAIRLNVASASSASVSLYGTQGVGW